MSASDDTPMIRAQAGEQRGMSVNLEGFEVSTELEAMARRLVHAHDRLRDLDQFEIAYLWDHGDPPRNGKACAWGKARLMPRWVQPLAPYDACITIMSKVWNFLRDRQREALLLHELMHLGQNPDSGMLEVVPHDIEEFGYVAAQYGAWRSSLEAFHEQLQLGLDPAGPLRDLANRTGTSITIEHDGRSATIGPDER